MKAVRITWLLGLLALVLAANSARAAQRVTLKLNQVTLHRALQSIRDTIGWDMRGPSGEGTDFYEPADNAPKADFTWKNAAIGKVCRDLGEAFRCTPTYGDRGVIQFEAKPLAVAPPQLSTSREGIAFTVDSVAMTRTTDLGVAKPVNKDELKLRLLVRPFDNDLDFLYSVDKVQAVDNLGHALKWDRKEPLRPQTPGSGEGRPDEWQVDATFPGVDSRARQLSRLEGELTLFQEVQNLRVEVPLSAQFPLKQTAGPVEINVQQVVQPGSATIIVRYDVSWPSELEVSTAIHGAPGWPYAAARLASGRITRMGGSGNGGFGNQRRRSVITCVHEGNGGDPPVALVWDLQIKSQPNRKINFRLDNVPLPGLGGTAPPGKVPPAAPLPVLSRDGAVSSPVFLGEMAAGEGELSIGLSPRRPDGTFGAVRWKILPTDERGQAVLDGIVPGTYRILRKFRPRGPDRELLPAGGTWQNDSVLLKVEAGKTLPLPPLKRVMAR